MSVPDGMVCIVSIAELPNNSSRSFSTVGADFERTPPQDLIAEQSVLGAMMLSKDAIADVIEVIRERDFYRPAHELIFDAILDLYGRGEPADAITVSAELTKRGDIARAGGAPYLHTLISSVPTAANGGYYAKIILEHAIMRRLIEAGTKIVQLGYNGEGNLKGRRRRRCKDWLPRSRSTHTWVASWKYDCPCSTSCGWKVNARS